MKTTLSFALLAAVSILAPAQGRPSSYNILLDPGFENTAHPNWDNTSGIYYPNGSYYLTPWGGCVDGPHAGSYAWNFDAGLFQTYFTTVSRVRQAFAAVPTSQVTNVSCWAASDGAPIGVVLYYSDGTYSSASYALGKNAYQYVNATSIVAPGKSLTAIEFVSVGPIAGKYLFMDDANVTRKVAG